MEYFLLYQEETLLCNFIQRNLPANGQTSSAFPSLKDKFKWIITDETVFDLESTQHMFKVPLFLSQLRSFHAEGFALSLVLWISSSFSWCPSVHEQNQAGLMLTDKEKKMTVSIGLKHPSCPSSHSAVSMETFHHLAVWVKAQACSFHRQPPRVQQLVRMKECAEHNSLIWQINRLKEL